MILIIFIQLQIINNYFSEIKTETKETKILEEILFVETLISDCEFLANQKQKICYKNNISFNEDIEYKKHNLTTITINNKEYYKSGEKNRCYKRGVIYKRAFALLEVCYER